MTEYKVTLPLRVKSNRDQLRDVFIAGAALLDAEDYTIGAQVTDEGITVTVTGIRAVNEGEAKRKAIYWCKKAASKTRKLIRWTGMPISDAQAEALGG